MAAAQTNKDVHTTLEYAVDDGSRHFYVAYQPTQQERDANGIPQDMGRGQSKSVDVVVRDGRGKNLTLDANSFELVEQSTALSTEEFYDCPDKVKSTYYAEMAEVFKKATGAAHVHVFHHQVRSADKNNADGNGFNTSVQPYAHAIHSDSSAHSAEQLFLAYADSPVDPKYCKGRFLYINAWRNISEEPIENDPLAVCDEASLVKPDDYVSADLYMPGPSKITQYKLGDRNAAQHRWYYFSKMKKNEVLLFKQWDSDPKLAGRVCFHTAFRDPNASPDAPCRQSIECRGVAFFPDHEPNTCPVLRGETNADTSDEVTAAVKKVLGLVGTMTAWPAFAKQWLKTTASKRNGVVEVARTIIDDQQNYQGFKHYSAEAKAEILERVLQDGWGAKVRTQLRSLNSGPSVAGVTFQSLKIFIPAVLAFGAGYMLRSRK